MYHTIVGPILNVLLMFAAGAVLLFISARVRSMDLWVIFATLSAFTITHGLYHFAIFLKQPVLALVILQPISVLFLLAFAFMLLRRG